MTDLEGDAELRAWCAAGWSRPSTVGSVEVAGAAIAYETWGRIESSDALPLVLIHGTAANRTWWAHIAGWLSDDRCVAAVDLSGHGDSSHRATYDVATWTDEVVAVIHAVNPDGRGAQVVGHSLGGTVAAATALRAEVPIAAIVMCETIRDPREPHHPVVKPRPRPYFATKDDALARFRSLPIRASGAAAIVDLLAERSIVHDGHGWTWKHDTTVASILQPIVPTLDSMVPSITGGMAIVRGEDGLVSDADVERLCALVPGRIDVVTLPGAGHHPMLDAPRELTAMLRSLSGL